MLLTLTTTRRPATDLGFLLHKHPERFQSYPLSFGAAQVFYPEVSEERCTACLLLEVDAVGLRSLRGDRFLPGGYVNDRAYTASSLLSVAISQVFGSALNGRCRDRPELVEEKLPLTAGLHVLPVRGRESFLREVFEPLGYSVNAERMPLDERFPEWGESPYYAVTLEAETTLAALLAHLYVLIPVFDNQKHYFVGADELEKLLTRGAGWLGQHPLKEEITRRFLRNQGSLVHEALERLVEAEPEAVEDEACAAAAEEQLERPLSLQRQRIEAVLAELRNSGASSVLDLGCGEGALLRELLRDIRFERIVGLDVCIGVLEGARRRLKLDRLPARQAQRLELLHGSITYRDRRLTGFEAAALVEVIEHLDPPRLAACERVVFECARPGTVVLTTPNREYNIRWESLPSGNFRHNDHRFEWTRAEFAAWSGRIAERYGYTVRHEPVGPVDEEVGPPTQMAVFTRVTQSPSLSTEA